MVLQKNCLMSLMQNYENRLLSKACIYPKRGQDRNSFSYMFPGITCISFIGKAEQTKVILLYFKKHKNNVESQIIQSFRRCLLLLNCQRQDFITTGGNIHHSIL